MVSTKLINKLREDKSICDFIDGLSPTGIHLLDHTIDTATKIEKERIYNDFTIVSCEDADRFVKDMLNKNKRMNKPQEEAFKMFKESLK